MKESSEEVKDRRKPVRGRESLSKFIKKGGLNSNNCHTTDQVMYDKVVIDLDLV